MEPGSQFVPSLFSPHGARAPSGPGPLHIEAPVRHATRGRTDMDEWSARRRDLYLTTHNTHRRQTPMLPEGIKPTIPAYEQAADTL